MKTRTLVILGLSCFLILSSQNSQAASELEIALSQLTTASSPTEIQDKPPVIAPGALYNFSEHLYGTDAMTYLSDKGEVIGEWKETYYTFPGLPPKADIRLTAAKGSSMLQWNPISNASRRLTFYDVVPGKKITLYYRVDQEKTTKENNYMSLTIWVGQHQAKRLRLAPLKNKNGWQKEVIDLGVASFLNKVFPVTLEIGTGPSDILLFTFGADIRR